jgi:hypothetical protein
VSRTLALVLTGVLAGTLVYGGVSMFVVAIQYPSEGDTPSVEFAPILIGLALLLTLAATLLTVGAGWGPRLARWVGAIAAILGLGGLVYVIGASLVVSGAFPLLLLTPDNLSVELWLALAAITGIGLFRSAKADRAPGDDATTPWIGRSWHPVFVGLVLGAGLAVLWSVVIYPLIPYECCLII